MSRRILNEDELRFQILRERDRSDRGDSSFSVVLILLTRSSKGQREQAVHLLSTRLRRTDDIAILSDHQIGLLLPETESDSACSIAASLMDELRSLSLICEGEVFSYPHDEIPFDEQSASLRKNERTEQPMSARPLEFSQRMPFWKRGFDILVSLTALIVLSPVLLIAAMLIKVTSPGPIFFVQWREGKGGKKFRIFKLRTMRVDAETDKDELRHLNEQDGPAFKIQDDPRLTWIGRFLRKSCIDEAPQFLNILRGEMSIVGPRPLPVNESQACSRWQRRRLDVTPGMTCTWQVANNRDMPFEEWMRMDERYVQNMSFRFDLWLLMKTAYFVVLRRASV